MTILETLEAEGLDAGGMLVEVNRAIKAVLTAGQSYSIGGRTLNRGSLGELRAMRTQLTQELQAQAAGPDSLLGASVAIFGETGR